MSNQTSAALTAKLCLAITEDNKYEIENLINDSNFNVHIKTKAGYSPLYYAVLKGNLDVVKRLYEKGANLSDTYDDLTLRDIVKQKIELTKLDQQKFNQQKIVEIEEILKVNKIDFNQTKLDEFSDRIKPFISDSQNWIKSPAKVNFQHHSKGYCYGVTHMAIQAFLLEERDAKNNLVHLQKFRERTKLLDFEVDLYPKTFFENVEIAKHKRILLLELAKQEYDQRQLKLDNKEKQIWLEEKINKQLSPQEKVYLDIQPFLEGVELSQQAYKHNELLEKELSKQTSLPVMSLLATPALEKKGGIVIVDHFSGVYSEQELISLLQAIREQIDKNNYPAPFTMQLGANNHAVMVGYDPKNHEWELIDANKLSRNRMEANNEKYFCSMLRDSLFSKNNNLLIETNIFSTVARCKELKEKVTDPLRQTTAWQNAHAITQAKLDFKDNRDRSWSTFAIRNQDKDIYNKIVKFKDKKKNIFLRHKKAFIAAGAVLLGSAIIVGGVFSLGILPVAVSLIGVGALAISLGTVIPAQAHVLDKKSASLASDKEELLQAALKESDKFKNEETIIPKATTHQKVLTTLNDKMSVEETKAIFLENKLKSHAIYHGEIDSNEAKSKLNNSPDNTCLVRYSPNQKGYYLSINEGEIIKNIELSDKDMQLVTEDFEKFKEQIKMPNLIPYLKIHHENHVKPMPAPIPKSSPSIATHELYHGEIDSIAARNKLLNEPDGTCLVRFSTNRNNYYLSIKNGNSTEEVLLNKADIEKLLTNVDQFREDMKKSFPQELILLPNIQPTKSFSM